MSLSLSQGLSALWEMIVDPQSVFICRPAGRFERSRKLMIKSIKGCLAGFPERVLKKLATMYRYVRYSKDKKGISEEMPFRKNDLVRDILLLSYIKALFQRGGEQRKGARASSPFTLRRSDWKISRDGISRKTSNTLLLDRCRVLQPVWTPGHLSN